ncbi:hypothetical protein GCM10009087_51730 [Sphingomonas oligophenolica]|uniref:Uncharacterized protein n=1 Tax=Sphingomonas oligophenolica TaxID=301154 RepID=A0ABU9Y6S0_9SPHN
MVGVAALLALSLGTSSPACAYDRPTMLRMSVDAFDQTDNGWRRIGERKGCEKAGAALIAAYVTRHRSGLSSAQRDQLAWHHGQLLALAGETHQAISVFRGIRDSEPAQYWYREATIAFLRRDKPALLRARAGLVSLPKPADFDAMATLFRKRFGQELTWPTNLDTVNDLVRCFDAGYRFAYSGTCPRSH